MSDDADDFGASLGTFFGFVVGGVISLTAASCSLRLRVGDRWNTVIVRLINYVIKKNILALKTLLNFGLDFFLLSFFFSPPPPPPFPSSSKE